VAFGEQLTVCILHEAPRDARLYRVLVDPVDQQKRTTEGSRIERVTSFVL
jgi:hypothetical protein